MSVEEQHEAYVTEIKDLKERIENLENKNKGLTTENEKLKKLIMKLSFQTVGTVRLNEWVHLEP